MNEYIGQLIKDDKLKLSVDKSKKFGFELGDKWVGEEKIISNTIIDFKKITKENVDNYTSIRAEIDITQNDNKLKFYPELRLYKTPETITSEADIKINLFNDNLLVVNYLKETDYLNIRYQKKPFMLFIWLSAVMLSLGGILGLRDKLK